MMQRIAVFCGSASGRRPEYEKAARELGAWIGQNGRTLVFGGCQDGLMKAVSQAALQAGARIESEFIDHLYRDSDHIPGAAEHIHPTLQDRKRGLILASDAFVALPGGMGTLDEFSEVFAMTQLGMAKKPLGLVNVKGFYDPLLRQLRVMLEEGFLAPEWESFVLADEDPGALLNVMDRLGDGSLL